MKIRIALLLALVAAIAVPLTAAAHESCVTDDAGDADPGYDIGEFCVSGGDEDPVEFSAVVDAVGPDFGLTWGTDGWTVAMDGTGAITVDVQGEVVTCAATGGITDGVLLEAFVPATCLPAGTFDILAATTAAGFAQDETAVAVGGVPATDGGHGGEHGGSTDGLIRLEGGSRIETAVAISADSYPAGAPAVLLANADNPVDALPASRSTYDGPILYVPSCGALPQVVADEITRLQPADVVVLGGAAAICDDIAQAALAARDAGAPARVEGTPNPAATPADQLIGEDGFDVRTADFQLLDTRPAGYDDAAGQAFIARSADGVTVTLRVTGLIPDTQYVSHLHSGSCADGGGEHFQFDPAGGDTPPNEIHLPFTSDADGAGVQTSTHTEVPGEDARSIIIHPRDNGPARVVCAEWPAA